VAIGAFALAAAPVGVPLLRHDWAWPHAPWQAFSYVIETWSGWDPTGIGSAAPYPNSYLLVLPFELLIAAFGEHYGLLAALAIFAAACMMSARAIALEFRCDLPSRVVIALLALFNAWVYDKVVAGHLAMLFAYAATLYLVALIVARNTSVLRRCAVLALAFGQLQFFAISLAVIWLYLGHRGAIRVYLFAFIIALPTIVGIILEWQNLQGIPFTLPWQQGQSVSFLDALTMRGYFAGYDLSLDPLLVRAMWILLPLLTVSALIFRERVALVATLTAVLLSIFLTGATGPVSSMYSWLVVHVRASAFFRELFDLVAYIAVAYIVGLSAILGRERRLVWAGAVGIVLLVVAWGVAPPSKWFVPSTTVPQIEVSGENERFALFPAFGPMTYRGRGSGTDPDRYNRASDVTPINTYTESYPESVALIQGTAGDLEPLAALGVTTIITRPYLQSDVGAMVALHGGRASVPTSLGTLGHTRRVSNAIPELTMGPVPRIVGIGNRVGDGNVQFGDAAPLGGNVPRLTPVIAPNRAVNAGVDWVDIRLIYLKRPELAQGFGGAFTTQDAKQLNVPAGKFLLANVRGRLLSDNGRAIATTTRGYLWLPLPHGVRAVVCRGACAVAAVAGGAIPVVAANTTRPHLAQVTFTSLMPWLAIAHLPPGPAASLRQIQRYDSTWVAVGATGLLTHVRLDRTINGWLLPPRHLQTSVVLFHVTSVVQTLCELIGVALVLSCLVFAFRLGRFWKNILRWGVES